MIADRRSQVSCVQSSFDTLHENRAHVKLGHPSLSTHTFCDTKLQHSQVEGR